MKGKTMGKGARRIAYVVYFIFAVFLLLEIGLRIYNPFHLRLKGNRIVLPVNQKITILNKINPKLDTVIVNTRNNLGFRGPELPLDRENTLTIITIGGSTTECSRSRGSSGPRNPRLLRVLTITVSSLGL